MAPAIGELRDSASRPNGEMKLDPAHGMWVLKVGLMSCRPDHWTAKQGAISENIES